MIVALTWSLLVTLHIKRNKVSCLTTFHSYSSGTGRILYHVRNEHIQRYCSLKMPIADKLELLFGSLYKATFRYHVVLAKKRWYMIHPLCLLGELKIEENVLAIKKLKCNTTEINYLQLSVRQLNSVKSNRKLYGDINPFLMRKSSTFTYRVIIVTLDWNL